MLLSTALLRYTWKYYWGCKKNQKEQQCRSSEALCSATRCRLWHHHVRKLARPIKHILWQQMWVCCDITRTLRMHLGKPTQRSSNQWVCSEQDWNGFLTWSRGQIVDTVCMNCFCKSIYHLLKSCWHTKVLQRLPCCLIKHEDENTAKRVHFSSYPGLILPYVQNQTPASLSKQQHVHKLKTCCHSFY